MVSVLVTELVKQLTVSELQLAEYQFSYSFFINHENM